MLPMPPDDKRKKEESPPVQESRERDRPSGAFEAVDVNRLERELKKHVVVVDRK